MTHDGPSVRLPKIKSPTEILSSNLQPQCLYVCSTIMAPGFQ